MKSKTGHQAFAPYSCGTCNKRFHTHKALKHHHCTPPVKPTKK